jgi:hypothetical protein
MVKSFPTIAGTTFHTRPPSCLLADPKHLIASNTSVDLIKPFRMTYKTFFTAAAARRQEK